MDDVNVRGGEVVFFAQPVEHGQEAESVRGVPPAVLPQRGAVLAVVASTRLVHLLFRPLVDNWDALRQHHPSEGVEHAGLVAGAYRRDPHVVVVVDEVPQQELVRVQAPSMLPVHVAPQARQVQVGEGVEVQLAQRRTEGGRGDEDDGEVQQAVCDVTDNCIALVGGVESHVRRRIHLGKDGDRELGLDLLQEGLVHVVRRVKAKHVDVVSLGHAPRPTLQVLADERVRLVEISQCIEPAISNICLVEPVVAGATPVADAATQDLRGPRRGGATVDAAVAHARRADVVLAIHRDVRVLATVGRALERARPEAALQRRGPPRARRGACIGIEEGRALVPVAEAP
mmetsp:Transcript_125306/g.350897  ORF Transcript_125306/g.350897 Transcript_125306/m.350897 type:complete len:343 (-) Transcript_125306:615-1643(-)